MRLLVISDIHGQLKETSFLEDAVNKRKSDALVVCGDLTHFGNLIQVSLVLESFKYLGLPILFVPGNCDPKELASKSTFDGSENLHGRCVTLFGRNIIGVGGCTRGPLRTPFELSEAEIQKTLTDAYWQCSNGLDTLIISHDPPHGTKVDQISSGQHVGSRAVHDFVLYARPLLVMCGHIHEARGTDSIGTTMVVNPGPFHRGFYSLVDITDEVGVVLETFEKKG